MRFVYHLIPLRHALILFPFFSDGCEDYLMFFVGHPGLVSQSGYEIRITPDKPRVAIFILIPANSKLTEVKTKSTRDNIHSHLSNVQFCGNIYTLMKQCKIVQVLYLKVKFNMHIRFAI